MNKSKRTICVGWALLVALWISPNAFAQIAQNTNELTVGARVQFGNQGQVLQKTGQNSWAELGANGQASFTFTESAVSPTAIQLTDNNRANTALTIDLSARVVRYNGQPYWTINTTTTSQTQTPQPKTSSPQVDIRNRTASITFTNNTGKRIRVFYTRNSNDEKQQETILAPWSTRRLENTEGHNVLACTYADFEWGTAIKQTNGERNIHVEFDGTRLNEVQSQATPPRTAPYQPVRSSTNTVTFSNHKRTPLLITFTNKNGQSLTRQIASGATISNSFKMNERFSLESNSVKYDVAVGQAGHTTISDYGVNYNGLKIEGTSIAQHSHRFGEDSHQIFPHTRIYLESSAGKVGFATNKGLLKNVVQVSQQGTAYYLKNIERSRSLAFDRPATITTQDANNTEFAITEGAYWNTYLQGLNNSSEQSWVFEKTTGGRETVVSHGAKVYIRRSDKTDVYLYAKPDGVLGVTNRVDERTLFTLKLAN